MGPLYRSFAKLNYPWPIIHGKMLIYMCMNCCKAQNSVCLEWYFWLCSPFRDRSKVPADIGTGFWENFLSNLLKSPSPYFSLPLLFFQNRNSQTGRKSKASQQRGKMNQNFVLALSWKPSGGWGSMKSLNESSPQHGPSVLEKWKRTNKWQSRTWNRTLKIRREILRQ